MERTGAGGAPHRLPWGALVAGIAALSTASVLIRLTDAPSLVVGAWRLSLATLILTPWALPRFLRAVPSIGRGDAVRLALSGLALAAHFAAWIASLSYTSVASSVVLVTTTPIYVGLASHFFLRERVDGRRWVAIGVAVAGGVVIGYGDLQASGAALLGDALALVGALAMATHLLLGRRLRRTLSTPAYVWPVYGVAALALMAGCLVARQPLLGYDRRTYAALALLALVPQVFGHSIFNWALARVSPLVVTLAILGEPVGASALAFLVLKEAPPPTLWLGGPLLLAGLVLASWEGTAAAHPPPATPPVRQQLSPKPARRTRP